MGRSFSARAWGAVLICTAALVAGTATTAGATTTTSHTATVTGQATHLPPDGTCPPNPNAPAFPEYRINVVGRARTRVGPAKVTLRLCEISSSALGGEGLGGTFSIETFAGTLRGSVDGTLGFEETDDYHVTLTVEHAGFLLTGVRGTIALAGNASRDDGSFTGTLTSNLHRERWGRSTAMAFS
jgi:hypothetical protein